MGTRMPEGEERLEAERLHRRALAAEARALAKTAAKERGVALEEDEERSKREAESAKKPVFVPRAKREAAAKKEAEEEKKNGRRLERRRYFGEPAPRPAEARLKQEEMEAAKSSKTSGILKKRAVEQSEEEVREIRAAYLGEQRKRPKQAKPSEKFNRVFQFEWDAEDDTSTDLNPLYARRHALQPMLGRGYVAGVDMREQRKKRDFADRLAEKRSAEQSLNGRVQQQQQQQQQRLQQQQQQREREFRRQQQQQPGREEEKEAPDKDKEKKRRRLIQDGDLGGEAHWSEKALEAMTERDWRIFKEDFDIRVRGGRAPTPMRRWEEAKMADALLRAVRTLGYAEPTPIQRIAIPVCLALRDVIGVAETGSGKTAAFGIPLLHYVLHLPRHRIANLAEDGPLALVMAPTRELATQISQELLKLAQFTDIKCCTVVGGSSIEDQAFKLREGVQVVVGTPGRLNDVLESQRMVLNQANYVVLDEADRMIDMGFEPQVISVLDSMGGLLKSEDESELLQQEQAVINGESLYRVTAMFSATMPPAVEKLAKTYLRHPAIVAIGDEDSNKNKRITQNVVYLNGEAQKKNALLDMVARKKRDDKFLIFCNERKGCDAVHKMLNAAGFRAGLIHGGKSQDTREASLDAFKQGAFTVLVATDVAGRGLDIPDVAHVVNYDMPLKIESYCHRIGRTGRAGKEGLATTLLTSNDEPTFFELHQYLEQTDAHIPPALAKHPASHAKPGERNDRGELLTDKAASRAAFGKREFLKESIF